LKPSGAGALAGKRIVVTRAPEQAEELTARLERAGVKVISLPMVHFVETESTAELDHAIGQLERFDWVIFTSANAVRFFFRRARFLEEHKKLSGKSARSAPQYAVVGAATQKALEEEGLHAAFAPRQSGATAAVLAMGLAAKVSGKQVLIPRSDIANGELLAALRRAGASVTAVEAYRTASPQFLDGEAQGLLRGGDVDAITFFSPSAFHNFVRLLGAGALKELRDRVAFAAIGATTAAAIRQAGAPVSVEALESSPDSLVAALEQYFAMRETQKGSD
jgi:uroporphyrinogen III methyltransferase / synthase